MNLAIVTTRAAIAAGLCAAVSAAPLSDLDRFSYVLGTQTFGASYQFTQESRLVETAQAILDMGSNVLKFAMDKHYARQPNGNVREAIPTIKALTDLARDEPSYRRVFEMPFAHTIIWVYPFTGGWWTKGLSQESAENEYREIYDFAAYLLKTYNGSGKSFYLGHWEGDWHLRNGYDTSNDDSITPAAIQGMADWINTRQRAVDDAKRDTPHADVEVYNYVEVNLVRIGMEGRKCVTNDVIPKTDVDFVSYSSYDSGADLKPALDYVEAHLKPKAAIPGKRVFIGEYGHPVINSTPQKQDEHARKVMRAALEWGCPFALYWEMYNNEVTDDGVQRGFWLIDDKGAKQPAYETHASFLKRAREWVAAFREREGRMPTAEEYAKEAVGWL